MPTTPPSSPTQQQTISNIIIQSRGWSVGTPNPLLEHLHSGRKKDKGWLRILEKEYDTYKTNSNYLYYFHHLWMC